MASSLNHSNQCAREVIQAVALASRTTDDAPTLATWEAYKTGAAVGAIPRYHHCHAEEALLVIWLLAARLYETPEEFYQDAGAIIAPVALGETKWPHQQG